MLAMLWWKGDTDALPLTALVVTTLYRRELVL